MNPTYYSLLHLLEANQYPLGTIHFIKVGLVIRQILENQLAFLLDLQGEDYIMVNMKVSEQFLLSENNHT